MKDIDTVSGMETLCEVYTIWLEPHYVPELDCPLFWTVELV